MFGSNCCFLTCIEVSQEVGKVVWYSHLFEKFPQFVVIHTIRGFFIVNEEKVDVFSGILLLFLWSNRCWQFELQFLCLFKIQIKLLEVISSCNIEGSLGGIWKILCEHVKWVQLCGSWTWQCLSLGLEWKLTFSSLLPLFQISKFPKVEKQVVWEIKLPRDTVELP